jgi:hypothetical protein
MTRFSDRVMSLRAFRLQWVQTQPNTACSRFGYAPCFLAFFAD